MKNSIFFSVILASVTLWVTPVMAQESRTKSSKRYEELKKSRSVQNADDLLDEARVIKEENPALALDKVEEALGISLAQKDQLNEGRSYLILGEINETIEEWKLAKENFTLAYEKLKSIKTNSREQTQALQGLGRTNLKLGEYEAALQWYNEALLHRSNSGEQSEILLGISEVYFQMANYTEALKAVEKIPVSKMADEALEVRIQNQKAKIYARTNEVEKAQNALSSSQSVYRSNAGAAPSAPKQAAELETAKEEVASALHDQRLYDDEITLRNEAIEMNLESNNLKEVTRDKVGISKALEAKGETSEAIRELEEAALLADTTNNPKDQAKAFLALADIYERNGRTTQALSAYKRFSNAVRKSEDQTQTRLTERAELIRKQKDIQELTTDVAIGEREETIAKGTVFRQQLIIYGLLFIVLVTLVSSYFTYKNAQASKIANQLLALKSLRSQMNPHFIFNALNSVNQFIAQNDERTANKFLSEFSRLMRLVMENSQEDFIPLITEQEIIALYLKLEHYRFRDKFDYTFTIDEDINLETHQIPPMLLQPYIENAVWHGLRYKESKGELRLTLRKNDNGIEVEITDNGIGRRRSAELKTDNQKRQISTGLKNIEERLHIINKVYKARYVISVSDLEPTTGEGTRVCIRVPSHKQNRLA